MKGLLLLCLCASSFFYVSGQYNYAEVLEKSILFYEAQRSGALPGDNRVPWRGDSALGDGQDNGLDLTGGWYDAGDHVKFGFPMAWSATTIAWSLVEFRAGYENAGQLTWALDSLQWVLDYFIKCHPSNEVFYGQVGDGEADHAYWGRPEDMTMFRPSYAITTGGPGSDMAGETSAAMAAGSMVFRATDPGYADTLLSHARTLHDFAYNYRGLYTGAIPSEPYYVSSGYNDELAWSSVWLYRATGEQVYLDRAREFYSDWVPWASSWDDKNAGVQVLMYIVTGESQYASHAEAFIRSYMPGGVVPYTPLGLAWLDQWGTLRYTANAAFVALAAANNGIIAGDAIGFAAGQIDYMLGNGGRSYVCGFGNNPPQRPHHRSSSCPPMPEVCDWAAFDSPDPNPNVLNGALVGGPDQNDQYVDDRGDYVSNEVTTDYNAGFQGAIAGMLVLGA